MIDNGDGFEMLDNVMVYLAIVDVRSNSLTPICASEEGVEMGGKLGE